MNHYQNFIDQLFQVNLFGGIKLGLQHIQKLDQAMDYPSKKFRSIHVAGSNGKGSVTTKIAKGLELSKMKTGLYTSPHISCFRERIKINGEMVSEEDVVKLLEEIFNIKKLYEIPATFFELTTILGFTYFAKKQVDCAVIETGLGGRLDATNILDPILSIITSISFDHTDILGDTIEKITLEKAGIIKPYKPILIGPKVPFKIIENIAKENQSPLIVVDGSFQSYDEENNAIAKKAMQFLNIEESLIEKALQVRPSCRMEIISHQNRTIILDVAHNPDGLKRFFHDVQNQFPNRKRRIIFGLSKNKDITECLNLIKESGDAFHLVEATNGRGLPLDQLEEKMKDLNKPVKAHRSIEEAVSNSLKYNDLIIVCGTFFIMGDVKKALCIEEPKDLTDMNERNLFKI